MTGSALCSISLSLSLFLSHTHTHAHTHLTLALSLSLSLSPFSCFEVRCFFFSPLSLPLPPSLPPSLLAGQIPVLPLWVKVSHHAIGDETARDCTPVGPRLTLPGDRRKGDRGGQFGLEEGDGRRWGVITNTHTHTHTHTHRHRDTHTKPLPGDWGESREMRWTVGVQVGVERENRKKDRKRGRESEREMRVEWGPAAPCLTCAGKMRGARGGAAPREARRDEWASGNGWAAWMKDGGEESEERGSEGASERGRVEEKHKLWERRIVWRQ